MAVLQLAGAAFGVGRTFGLFGGGGQPDHRARGLPDADAFIAELETRARTGDAGALADLRDIADNGEGPGSEKYVLGQLNARHRYLPAEQAQARAAAERLGGNLPAAVAVGTGRSALSDIEQAVRAAVSRATAAGTAELAGRASVATGALAADAAARERQASAFPLFGGMQTAVIIIVVLIVAWFVFRK